MNINVDNFVDLNVNMASPLANVATKIKLPGSEQEK